ncbi:MAG: sugar nucleotide-binding protein [Bacteroidota bacterium]|nr:sugar nucleotide-binding protein [Bacteroidota bacterium]
MKILITGGSGLLGQYLNIFLSRENQILTLYNSNEGNCLKYNSVKCELTDFKKLKKIILSFAPEIIIHTAAISRPETCDELPEEYVIDVNINSTKEISMICEKSGTKLIFTSTDLVYNGDAGQMHKEDSKLYPVSLYAETKVHAEEEIKNIFENYIILRTSLLFGLGLNNSVNNFHNMYYSFKNKKPVKLFYDQFRTPLSLIDAAKLLTLLIKTDINNITVNFGGRQRVSRVELGEMLCEIGKYDKSLIEKTSMYDVAKLHKVADVSMNTEKLQSLGLKQKSIEDSIWEIVNNEQ